jgi:GH15 family glucan-1,4-alpha-glucosidase
MYGLHGESTAQEVELSHLEGYKGSKPVRIGPCVPLLGARWLLSLASSGALAGNGAFSQVQLDIYGELMDTIYLSVRERAGSCELALATGATLTEQVRGTGLIRVLGPCGQGKIQHP